MWSRVVLSTTAFGMSGISTELYRSPWTHYTYGAYLIIPDGYVDLDGYDVVDDSYGRILR